MDLLSTLCQTASANVNAFLSWATSEPDRQPFVYPPLPAIPPTLASECLAILRAECTSYLHILPTDVITYVIQPYVTGQWSYTRPTTHQPHEAALTIDGTLRSEFPPWPPALDNEHLFLGTVAWWADPRAGGQLTFYRCTETTIYALVGDTVSVLFRQSDSTIGTIEVHGNILYALIFDRMIGLSCLARINLRTHIYDVALPHECDEADYYGPSGHVVGIFQPHAENWGWGRYQHSEQRDHGEETGSHPDPYQEARGGAAAWTPSTTILPPSDSDEQDCPAVAVFHYDGRLKYVTTTIIKQLDFSVRYNYDAVVCYGDRYAAVWHEQIHEGTLVGFTLVVVHLADGREEIVKEYALPSARPTRMGFDERGQLYVWQDRDILVWLDTTTVTR